MWKNFDFFVLKQKKLSINSIIFVEYVIAELTTLYYLYIWNQVFCSGSESREKMSN